MRLSGDFHRDSSFSQCLSDLIKSSIELHRLWGHQGRWVVCCLFAEAHVAHLPYALDISKVR